MSATTTFRINKVQKLSTEVKAADTMRDAIVGGEIPLGTRLTELGLSEQLGVSRSTIRTALHQLVQEGLVIQVPYTGWTVMTLSAHDAWELYTLRASLEGLATRIVAEQIRDSEGRMVIRDNILGAFGRMKEACADGDKRRIATTDMQFHKTIVDLSGHSRLMGQYALIQHQILIYIRSSDALITDPAQIIEQHRPLVEALTGADIDAAVEAAALHNEIEGRKLVEFLRQDQAEA